MLISLYIRLLASNSHNAHRSYSRRCGRRPFGTHESQGDFTGEDGTYSPASEADISITCGSCADSALAEGTSAASKLAVGVVTAGGAGIVAVASTWGGW